MQRFSLGGPMTKRHAILGMLGGAVSAAAVGVGVGVGQAVVPRANWRRLCPICVDCHAHFLDEKTLDIAQPRSAASGLSRDLPIMRKMLEPALQIEDMDRRGIDRSIISSATVIQGLWFAEGDQATELNRHLNNVAADWVSRHPQRFIGSFCLPLGDVAAAIAELERAVSLGLNVANLPSQHRGEYLGSPRFEPLWAAIESHGVIAFIHPDGVKDPWFKPYLMWNSIGQSIEEVKVMTSLIYEGTLERHPRLKVVMAHGGGYMPHYMGRLDRNAEEQPQATMMNISQKPSAYLRRFHYDSCVYDPMTLKALIARVGIDRIVLGGDYPVAALDPLKFIEDVPGLSPSDVAAIAGNNAVSLLGL